MHTDESIRDWTHRTMGRKYGRGVIALVCVGLLFAAIRVWSSYQREYNASQIINELGGDVIWEYRGPSWVSTATQKRLWICNRIRAVCCSEENMSVVVGQFDRIHGLDFFDVSSSRSLSREEIAILKSLPKRTEIYLELHGIADDDLRSLHGLTNLSELIISGSQISGSGLAYLQGNASLRNLCVRGDHLAPAELIHLKKLTSLKLLGISGKNITDATAEHLSGLDHLSHLFLDDTQITTEGCGLIQKSMPACRVRLRPGL